MNSDEGFYEPKWLVIRLVSENVPDSNELWFGIVVEIDR